MRDTVKKVKRLRLLVFDYETRQFNKIEYENVWMKYNQRYDSIDVSDWKDFHPSLQYIPMKRIVRMEIEDCNGMQLINLSDDKEEYIKGAEEPVQ